MSIPGGRAEAPDGHMHQSFGAAIASRQKTINTLDRLCMQVGRSLILLAKPDSQGFHAFVHERMDWNDQSRHWTTAAQCISAMQDLVRIMNGVKLKTPESPNLMFQALPDDSDVAADPGNLRDKLKQALEPQIRHLAGSRDALDGSGLGEMNPFTCAHVFSALIPTEYLVPGSPANDGVDNCTTALFGMLWALLRRRQYPQSQHETPSGAAMKTSLPTTFVTSLCIDAIESFIELLRRRWGRLDRITGYINDLEKLERDSVVKNHAPEWFAHRSNFFVDQINEFLREWKCDALMQGVPEKWQPKLQARMTECMASNRHCTLEIVHASFHDAIEANQENFSARERKIAESLAHLENRYRSKVEQAVTWLASDKAEEPDWKMFPDGLVDDRFKPPQEAQSARRWRASAREDQALESYWKDHRQAADFAYKTSVALNKYMIEIMHAYCKAAGLPCGDQADRKSVRTSSFVNELNAMTRVIETHVKQLHGCIAPAIHWAESVMDHQLALAREGHLGEFDVAELVHAARIIVRSGRTKDASAILEAVEVACNAQYPDGKWPCNQPFYWTTTGLAAYPQSTEVAWALVSIMRTLTASPETFGLSKNEVLARANDVNRTLERFLGWISANARHFEIPKGLLPESPSTENAKRSWVFGWCSDRTPEPGVIHAWATANVAEFLVEFRTYLQEQINIILRTNFFAYHPSDLKRMTDFHPPDLQTDYRHRIGTGLWEDLRLHRRRALTEKYWTPHADYKETPTNWSAVLAGPPGSAKSYLAQCIAGELDWPLIALSPSDFLSAGGAEIEARSREIFNALGMGTRLVYFFDEIDELILDRATTQKEGRSVFSFLTPSFLTKLQELRDAAKHKSFLFLVGTNYLDRIDPAAKRSGRIDKEILVMYPDAPSRRALLVKSLDKALKEHVQVTIKVDAGGLMERLDKQQDAGPSRIEKLVAATALLSPPALIKMCERIAVEISKGTYEDEEAAATRLAAELDGISAHNNKFAKREVDLSIYHGRPGALEEWIRMLSILYPGKREAKARDDEIRNFIVSLQEKDRGHYWKLHEKQIIDSVSEKSKSEPGFSTAFEQCVEELKKEQNGRKSL